jgi:FkbM family methyltransferase
MTDDELAVLMIASEGMAMAPIGRWQAPVESLTARGLMYKHSEHNYCITIEGREACKRETQERDQAFANALAAKRSIVHPPMHVDMTINGKRVTFDMTWDPEFHSDANTAAFLRHNGACEPEVVHLMRRVLRQGDFAIDGGANIGFFTLLMARLVGERGHVEAFEPQWTNFNKLRANIALNRMENVNAVNRPLWSENSEVVLHVHPDTGLCSLMPVEGEISKIPCNGLTLDRWCSMYENPCRLLKLDIEGAEEHALVGAQDILIKGIDFITCECNDRTLREFGSSQLELRDYMASKGYSAFMLHDDGSRPSFIDRGHCLSGPENMHILFSTEMKVHGAWEDIPP